MIDENGNRNGLPQIPGDAPAFPVNVPGCGDNGWHGMSLRDWLAGLAMQSLCFGMDPAPAAEKAYKLADAMLKARGPLTAGERGTP